MEIKGQKGIGEDTGNSLCCKTSSLIRLRQRIANFGLPVIVFIDFEVTISNKGPRFLEFDGNLKPLTGYTWLDLLLLLNKSACFSFTHPLPALIFGDCGVLAIGHEGRKIRIRKVSQAQPGCLERGESCSSHWYLFSLCI